jgi:hypothetical protein
MMKRPLLAFIVLSVGIIPSAASGQINRGHDDLTPPPMQSVFANAAAQRDGALNRVLSEQPEIPLGPLDVLREYENEMTSISQTLSAVLANISNAVRNGEISRVQAEYLIRDNYQLAMMRYQVVGALYDSLEHDLLQAAAVAKRSVEDAAADSVVVIAPPTSGKRLDSMTK